MTSPVIRCVKTQLRSEVHFLTKRKYEELLLHNPYIDKLYSFEEDWQEILPDLKEENYSLLVDLHKTVRSMRLRSAFTCPVISFDKLTIQKWMFLNLRINKLPQTHLVDQFFQGVSQIKVRNDQKGVELYVDETSENTVLRILDNLNIRGRYTALVIGGAHLTKQIPIELAVDYINKSEEPIVLIGGLEEEEKARKIVELSGRYINNMVGPYSMLESAILIRESSMVVTGDTGMMHIAATYDKKIIVVYGSTSTIFGMYPYMTTTEKQPIYLESDHLSCWPCSKSGRSKCPKSHMRCLTEWTGNDIINMINREAIRN